MATVTWDSATKASQVTLSNGNLTAAHGLFGANSGVRGTLGVTAGKWYWESHIDSVDGNDHRAGICNSSYTPSVDGGSVFSNTANGWSVGLNNGNAVNNASSSGYGSSYATNDTYMCALDMDNGKVWWGKNGTWFNSGAPGSGTNAAFTTGITGTMYPCDGNGTSGSTFTITSNFGASAFAYTVPSGFAGIGSLIRMRRTLSMLGTRVGNRQVVGF